MRLFLACAVMLLAGCEGSNTTASKPADTTVRVEPDTSPNAKNLSIDPLLPPGGLERPAKSGELGRTRTSDGLPILDAKGPNVDQLFAEDIKDPDKRMRRLENAVVEIRRDLDAALPAINRLVSIEGDIQDLVGQLQTLLAEEGGSATFMPRADTPTKPAPPAPPSATDKLIKDLKAQSPQSIEPLEQEDLSAPPAPMPKLAPITVTSEPTKKTDSVDNADDMQETTGQLMPEAKVDGKAFEGVSVEPMSKESASLMSITSLDESDADEHTDTPSAPVTSASSPSSPAPAVPLPHVKPSTSPAPQKQATVAAKPDATAKTSATKIEPSITATVASLPTALMVDQIRIGNHPDKVRVVIDLPAHTTFKTDLDNTEHILVVDLGNTPVTNGKKTLTNDLVTSLSAQSTAANKTGGQVIFELKKETRVLSATLMPPNATNAGYRLVIDLAK